MLSTEPDTEQALSKHSPCLRFPTCKSWRGLWHILDGRYEVQMRFSYIYVQCLAQSLVHGRCPKIHTDNLGDWEGVGRERKGW